MKTWIVSELPGLARPRVALAALAALAVAVAWVSAFLWLEPGDPVEPVRLACGLWAVGALWLVDGEVCLDWDALGDRWDLRRWTTYLLTVAVPVWIGWAVFGALLDPS